MPAGWEPASLRRVSEGDVWYFARGQEVMGPFSREIMRQIHEGGQLPPGTLVWREGMEGWKPVEEVAELGLAAPPASVPVRLRPPSVPPASPAPASASPIPVVFPAAEIAAPAAQRLKIKVRPLGSGTQGPPPSTMLRKSLAPDGQSFSAAPKDPVEKAPVAGHGTRKPPSWFQRMVAHIFSSLVMTPLFLIAAGALAIAAGGDFPNILELRWIFVAFGVYGVVSLFGARGYEGLFRWLALAVFLPPLAILWPMIMREVPVTQVSVGRWVFLGICLLYFVTMRVGLRAYLGGVGSVGVVTGLLTLAFLLGIWKTDLEKAVPGWETMVQDGSTVRLPGVVVRLLSLPDSLGTREGTLRLRLGKEEAEVGIECAAIESKGTEGWRLTIVLLGGQQLSARFKPVAEGSEIASVVGKDASLTVSAAGMTSREGLEEVDTLAPARPLRFNGKNIEIASGSIRITKLDTTNTCGTVSFLISGQKEPTPLSGEFDTKMIRR